MTKKAQVLAIGVLATVCMGLPYGDASAKALITQMTGPSSSKFPVGRLLNEPLEIVLVSGDRLTVLDAIGTRVLIGPVRVTKGEVRQPPEPRMAQLRMLFENRARARAAGSRSTVNTPAGGQDSPRTTTQGIDHLWTISTSAHGDWCVNDPDNVEIARSKTSTRGKLEMTSPSGATYEAVWPRGERIVYWPAEARISEGSVYQIKYDQDEGGFLTLHIIRPQENDLLMLGSQLLDRNCTAQFDLLFGI